MTSYLILLAKILHFGLHVSQSLWDDGCRIDVERFIVFASTTFCCPFGCLLLLLRFLLPHDDLLTLAHGEPGMVYEVVQCQNVTLCSIEF